MRRRADRRGMTAPVPEQVVESGSTRILADVRALGGHCVDERTPALIRLEAAIGRDFAERLVTALSAERDVREG
jgi:hypothetical protein